jgi:hypothetical protein
MLKKIELNDNGVLIVRPKGALQKKDFDMLSKVTDPWIKTHHHLQGVVISVRKFPGWENFSSFIQHIEFVKTHYRHVQRVALAVNGILPEIMSQLAGYFVKAKIKHFPFENIKEAIQWAEAN